METIKLGITVGDVNGIGPEVIIKLLSNEAVLNHFTPVIYGSTKVLAYHKNIVGNPSFTFSSIQSPEKAREGKISVINCWQDNVHITLGSATEDGGKCAYIALDRAIEDLKSKKIDALVTAPINKEAMKMANFPYPGHTEFVADRTGQKGSDLMMMVSDELKVGLVTSHVALSEVAGLIDQNRILNTLNHLNESLKYDFGLERPHIAVLGLNPHAGENASIGVEERDHIIPAIEEAKENGLLVSGPYPADGFFGRYSHRKFNAVLAMYHDQGLVPFKTLSFGNGVNFTAGLKVIRTSPDHGTGYDIAGENRADETSFRKACYLALDIARKRASLPSENDEKISESQSEERGSQG